MAKQQQLNQCSSDIVLCFDEEVDVNYLCNGKVSIFNINADIDIYDFDYVKERIKCENAGFIYVKDFNNKTIFGEFCYFMSRNRHASAIKPMIIVNTRLNKSHYTYRLADKLGYINDGVIDCCVSGVKKYIFIPNMISIDDIIIGDSIEEVVNKMYFELSAFDIKSGVTKESLVKSITVI